MKKDISWKIRRYDEENPDKILELRKKCFPREDLEKQKKEYWTWEFRDNYAGQSYIYAACDRDDVVGHYAVCPSFINVNGINRCGSIVVDVMTDPDYRYQGMFTALGRYSLDDVEKKGVDFSYGFPIRKTVMPGHIKVGWKIAFPLPVYVYPVSFYRMFKHFLPSKIISAILSLIPQMFFNISGFFHGNYLLTLKWDEKMGDSAEIAKFLSKIRRQHRIIQERSKEFITWRFDSNPYRKYEYLKIFDLKKEMVGYAILRRTGIFGLDCMIIVDMQALNCDKKIIDYMLLQIKHKAKEDKVALIGCMTNENLYKKRMTKNLYIRSPYTFKFIIHENGCIEYADLLYINNNWFLMWADTDDI